MSNIQLHSFIQLNNVIIFFLACLELFSSPTIFFCCIPLDAIATPLSKHTSISTHLYFRVIPSDEKAFKQSLRLLLGHRMYFLSDNST